MKYSSSRTRKNSSSRACGGTLAREEAHRTHDMTCKELVQRAKYLSSQVADGLLQIPTTVVDSVNKAIRLRKETASLVRALGQSDRDADLAHVHFIKALEEVRTLFGSVACGSSPKSRPQRRVTKTLYGRNIYEELDLHHVVEVDIDTNIDVDVVVEVEAQLAEAPKPNQDEDSTECIFFDVPCLLTADQEKLAKGPFWANVHTVHEMIVRHSDLVIWYESKKPQLRKIDADLNAVDLRTLVQGLFQTIDMLHELERCLAGYAERLMAGGTPAEYEYAQAWMSNQVALQSRCIVAFEETMSGSGIYTRHRQEIVTQALEEFAHIWLSPRSTSRRRRERH